MHKLVIFLFFVTSFVALIVFSGAFTDYPIYYNTVTAASYEFAIFLFWMFMVLFFVAVIFSATSGIRPISPSEQMQMESRHKALKDTLVGGFALALLLLLTAVISGLFGFDTVAATVAGLAVIIFWIDIGVGILAVAMSLYDYRITQH